MIQTDSDIWPDKIFQVLNTQCIKQVVYVPDSGHMRLIQRCQESSEINAIALTTEEEGIALLAGAWLGGQRGAILMQSSGVGNCINMLSLTRTCRLPLLMLITMRGQWGEFNPWQVPMGQNTEPVLKLAGVLTFAVDDSSRLQDTVEAAARMAFEGPAATAVLISQQWAQRLSGNELWIKIAASIIRFAAVKWLKNCWTNAATCWLLPDWVLRHGMSPQPVTIR
jgi:sulfopyruvate decarboxylase alpha subunit